MRRSIVRGKPSWRFRTYAFRTTHRQLYSTWTCFKTRSWMEWTTNLWIASPSSFANTTLRASPKKCSQSWEITVARTLFKPCYSKTRAARTPHESSSPLSLVAIDLRSSSLIKQIYRRSNRHLIRKNRHSNLKKSACGPSLKKLRHRKVLQPMRSWTSGISLRDPRQRLRPALSFG